MSDFPECEQFKGVLHRYQNCRHERLTPEQADRWRVSMGLEPLLPQTSLAKRPRSKPQPLKTEPVGTILKEIAESLNIPQQEGCDCPELQMEMDILGVAGCLRERERLLESLRKNFVKVHWINKILAIGPAIATGIAFKVNPSDPVPGVFDEAIRIATERAIKTKPYLKPGKKCCKHQKKRLNDAPKKPKIIRNHNPENNRNYQQPAERLPSLPYTEPVIRHLHYFIWPVKGNGTWQHNLDQLLQRIDLFNGRRRIGIATSENADPPEAVMDYLRGYECEFHVAPNNRKLREVVQFLPLLSPLESRSPNEVIFFAHAKGVSHGPPHDPGKCEHRWATIMYESLLDHWPLVEEALQSHAFCGSFRVYGQFRKHFDWHYAGTFYWARSMFVFDLPWRDLDQQLWGTETWPGRICHPAHAACLFSDHFNRRWLNAGDWRSRVEPEYERWKQSLFVTA